MLEATLEMWFDRQAAETIAMAVYCAIIYFMAFIFWSYIFEHRKIKYVNEES